MANILVIDGHPDASGEHFTHALAAAYADGARRGGHQVDVVKAGALDVPGVRDSHDFQQGTTPPDVAEVQRKLLAATHLVVIHPLWLGMMPAMLKGLFEQLLRPGFAFRYREKGLPERLLAGRSAHVVVTMGMPAFAYRWVFGAHGVRAFERSILRFCGFGPIRRTLIGNVEGRDPATREAWLHRMGDAGAVAR